MEGPEGQVRLTHLCPSKSKQLCGEDRIRTSDHLVPYQVRYRTYVLYQESVLKSLQKIWLKIFLNNLSFDLNLNVEKS